MRTCKIKFCLNCLVRFKFVEIVFVQICDETLNVLLKIFFRAHLRGQVFLVVCGIYEAFHVNPPSAKFLARV